MPELGKYAAEVLSAYAIAFVLIGGLIALTLIRRPGKARFVGHREAER